MSDALAIANVVNKHHSSCMLNDSVSPNSTVLCQLCGGSGDDVFGHMCLPCAGMGRLCDVCGEGKVVYVLNNGLCDRDAQHLCDICRQDSHDTQPPPAPGERHWVCVCGDTAVTHDDADSRTTYVECGCSRRMREVEATIPSPANDVGACEVVDEDADACIGALMQTAFLIQDAKDAGLGAFEVLHLVRQGLRRRA